ncbi:MAG: hypothetical protein Q9188_007629 [Gyalolechia gomerana]
MEPLNDSSWDVLISGTGLPQSLLAQALSRSGKKVLHIDQNDYYGGAEAAFSLQEVKVWVEEVNAYSRLGFSRAYSIAFAPHLIYTRSNLIPALISSKVYRQLEFLAVGSWWILDRKKNGSGPDSDAEASKVKEERCGKLRKIPGGREDVFADKSIDLRSTRSLMKFLKLAADAEAYSSVMPEWGERPFSEFLGTLFKIDAKLQGPLLALTLSSDPASTTTVAYALPRIHRHLTSIGIFGPGFGAVVPKWGGLAEIAQVACRAGAVGGGVYVLKKGIESIKLPSSSSDSSTTTEDAHSLLSKIRLQGGDTVQARWIIGTHATLPEIHDLEPEQQTNGIEITHHTAIISSPLASLFPPPAEGSPPPAGVVVVLLSDSFPMPDSLDASEVPPIYLIIHSSDTGECPEGQCIIYTYTPLSHPSAPDLLRSAIETLLSTFSVDTPAQPEILWSLTYKLLHTNSSSQPPIPNHTDHQNHASNEKSGVLHLKDLSPSLALEDEVLKDVREVWERITADDGEGRGGFMQFEDREGFGGGEEEEM